MKVSLNRYTLKGLSAVLLWSMTIGLARSISEQIGPITAAAAVYLTGGLLSIGFYIFKKDGIRNLTQVPRVYLYVCGTLFILYSTALFLALGSAENRYQTLEVGLVNYLWPTLTIVFSLFVLSMKASIWLIPGTLTAIAGVYFVTTSNFSFSSLEFIKHIGTNPIAYTLGFLAAVAWALYSNLVRLTSNNRVSGAVPVFLFFTGIVLFMVRYFYTEDAMWSSEVILEIAILGAITAIAYVFWDAAMRKGEMILVVSFSYLTPFFSTLFSSIYLSVFPQGNIWMGCFLIIIGSIISWRSIKTNKDI